MANETSVSRAMEAPPVWLASLCAALRRDFPVEVLPARITGKRWGCFNGSDEAAGADLPLSPPERVRIASDVGVLIYGWADLNETQREVLIRCIGHQALEGDDEE